MKKIKSPLVAAAKLSLLCALLTACGGGVSEESVQAGNGTGGGDSSDGGTNGTYSLSNIRLANGAGALLAAGGTTTIQVDVRGTGTNPAQVTFTSECATQGKGSFTNSQGELANTATAVDGVATIQFTDKGCGAKDTISARINSSRQQISLDIEPSVVQSIVFKSAAPAMISLKGTGGNETSTVTFEVKGNLDTPLANVPVELKLNTEVGGLCIANTATSTCSQVIEAVSNNRGQVTALVRAGSISTPVRVTATNLETNTYTVSSGLVVSTGVPDQDSMSLSIAQANPHGWEKDGEEVALVISLADAFNNPAPLGTAVSFWTEGGSITPNCTTDENGQCPVTWRSSNPRPADGLVTILAFAQGNESFVDLNGNGFYDAGFDKFTESDDLPEAFLDRNFNQYRDAADEEFVDFNRDQNYQSANGIYNGVLCLEEGNNCTKTGVTIRESVQLAMSSNEVGYFNVSEFLEIEADEVVDFEIYIGDLNGNTMPSGTTVSIATETKVTFKVHNPEIPKLNSVGRNTIHVTAKGGSVKEFGTFKVEVKSRGFTSSVTLPIN